MNRAQLQLLNSHTGFRSNSLTDTYGLYALPCFGLDQDWSIWVLRAAFGHVFVRETTILVKPAYLPLVNTATKGNINQGLCRHVGRDRLCLVMGTRKQQMLCTQKALFHKKEEES